MATLPFPNRRRINFDFSSWNDLLNDNEHQSHQKNIKNIGNFIEYNVLNQCCICFEEPDQVNKKFFMTVCHHKFCEDCITQWYIDNNKNTCPLCRNDFNNLNKI
jgi:hypothetical protein